MEWYKTVFELIDMRSFSNLWFWIALAVMWSSASHWVLGVPYDMVTRAKQQGGDAAADLESLVRINVRRLLFIARVSGQWLVGFAAFLITILVLLGFLYHIEFAQAVFLLAAPMTIVGALSLKTARKITDAEDTGTALYRRLMFHRMTIQAIGMVSIFITALWGMWQNLSIGAL